MAKDRTREHGSKRFRPWLSLPLIVFLFAVSAELFERVYRYGADGLSYRSMASMVRFSHSGFAPAIPPEEYRGCWAEVGLVPESEGWLMGVPFRVNSIGLRDKEYELERSPGVIRIALIGGSSTLGIGVPVEQTYQAILEERLNQRGPSGARYEVLNLALPANDLCLADALERAAFYRPDVVLWQCGQTFVSRPLEQLESNLQAVEAFASSRRIPVVAFHLLEAAEASTYPLVPSRWVLPLDNLDVSFDRSRFIYPSDGHPDAVFHLEAAEALFESFIEVEDEIRDRIDAQSVYETSWELRRLKPPLESNGFWRSYWLDQMQRRLEERKGRLPRESPF